MSNDQFLTILEAPVTVTLGKAPGIITALSVNKGTDKEGKAFKRLELSGDLNQKNDAGEPFKGSKSWNLLGRGAKDFCKEASAFTGTTITTNDLRNFNKALLIGKAAIFEVKERREGRKSVPYFTGFFAVASEATETK